MHEKLIGFTKNDRVKGILAPHVAKSVHHNTPLSNRAPSEQPLE